MDLLRQVDVQELLKLNEGIHGLSARARLFEGTHLKLPQASKAVPKTAEFR